MPMPTLVIMPIVTMPIPAVAVRLRSNDPHMKEFQEVRNLWESPGLLALFAKVCYLSV